MASVAKTVLLSPAQSDQLGIVASDSVPGAGATNLQDQRPTLLWQSTTNAPYLIFSQPNTGTPSYNALFLGYINVGGWMTGLTPIGPRTIRIRRGTSAAGTSSAPTWDSGAISQEKSANYAYKYPHVLMLFDSTSGSGGYWRVDFDWSGSIDQYVRAARVILGTYVSPADAVGPGWVMTTQEQVVEVEDIGSALTTRPRGVRRTLEGEWMPAMSQADAVAVQNVVIERGSSRDMVFCVDANEANYPMTTTVLGRIKQAVQLKHVPVQYRQLGFAVEELGVTEMLR